MAKTKARRWSRDNVDYLALMRAKKYAMTHAPKSESWWIAKSRDEFAAEVKARQTQRMITGSDGSRSLGKAVGHD